MQSRIEAVAQTVNKFAAKYELLSAEYTQQEQLHKEATDRQANALSAKQLVLAVAEQTQQNIGTRISNLVSLALASVFDEPYEFLIEFVQRRGVTEADLFFVKDGNRLEPMAASGGGAIDIASFALRVAVWSLNKTRPVLLLDEPFRNLSQDLHDRAGIMVQELSRKLGVQIIMVSHSQAIIAGADQVIKVVNGKVQVEK